MITIRDRLIIREKHPEFAEEYGRLTVPIFQAIEDGPVQSLYRRLNPRAAEGIDAMESKQDQDSF